MFNNLVIYEPDEDFLDLVYTEACTAQDYSGYFLLLGCGGIIIPLPRSNTVIIFNKIMEMNKYTGKIQIVKHKKSANLKERFILPYAKT